MRENFRKNMKLETWQNDLDQRKRTISSKKAKNTDCVTYVRASWKGSRPGD